MPKQLLAVSHRPQRTQADCLPVCVQMVMAFLGVDRSYEGLLDLLETRPFGTPFRNLERLREIGLTVTISHTGLAEIADRLQDGLPVLAGVNTGELDYWEQAVDHVVVGTDDESVYVQDPGLPSGPRAVPRTVFELAQLDFDNLCAVLSI